MGAFEPAYERLIDENIDGKFRVSADERLLRRVCRVRQGARHAIAVRFNLAPVRRSPAMIPRPAPVRAAAASVA